MDKEISKKMTKMDNGNEYKLNNAERIVFEKYKLEGYDIYRCTEVGFPDFYMEKENESFFVEVKTIQMTIDQIAKFPSLRRKYPIKMAVIPANFPLLNKYSDESLFENVIISIGNFGKIKNQYLKELISRLESFKFELDDWMKNAIKIQKNIDQLEYNIHRRLK
jgi:hypothetical protein